MENITFVVNILLNVSFLIVSFFYLLQAIIKYIVIGKDLLNNIADFADILTDWE